MISKLRPSHAFRKFVFFCHKVAHDDGLPLLICGICSSKLLDTHSFRITCLSAAELLTSIKLKDADEQLTDHQGDQFEVTNADYSNLNDASHSDLEVDVVLFETKPDIYILDRLIDIKQEEPQPADAKKRRANAKVKKLKQPKVVNEKDRKPKNRMDVCEICGIRTTNMTSHRLVHEQKRTIECDYCSKKFSHKNSLTLHFKIHMNYRFEDCTLIGFFSIIVYTIFVLFQTTSMSILSLQISSIGPFATSSMHSYGRKTVQM